MFGQLTRVQVALAQQREDASPCGIRQRFPDCIHRYLGKYQNRRWRASYELTVSDPKDAQQVPRADYPNDAAHHGLAQQSHDGELLCAAGTLSDYVALVARASFTLTKSIPVGDRRLDRDQPGRSYCFAGSRGSQTVSVISYTEQKEVARFSAGGLPRHLLSRAEFRARAACGRVSMRHSLAVDPTYATNGPGSGMLA